MALEEYFLPNDLHDDLPITFMRKIYRRNRVTYLKFRIYTLLDELYHLLNFRKEFTFALGWNESSSNLNIIQSIILFSHICHTQNKVTSVLNVSFHQNSNVFEVNIYDQVWVFLDALQKGRWIVQNTWQNPVRLMYTVNKLLWLSIVIWIKQCFHEESNKVI